MSVPHPFARAGSVFRRPLRALGLDGPLVNPETDTPPGQGNRVDVMLERHPFLLFGLLLTELVLILFVAAAWFQLEGLAFKKLCTVTVAGFAVNYFLPERARLPFFALLSVSGILVVFGLTQGAWLIALGLGLLGITHLPTRMRNRIVLLAIAAAGLVVARAGHLHVPWSGGLWPVLGSMFMLRLIIYVYDLAHRSAPISFWHALSYFFMLPNVCFPLFPVVDYQTFCRSHYNEPRPARLYQRGIHWMVRGTVQLIFYRFLYQHLPFDSIAVTSPAALVRYLLWPFLMYLQVSGLFHVVVGMLHLFGFNLPETHHLFYLASSFTDFWRRINIYWKDFMMKVFFYPSFVRLRRFGHLKGVVLSTFFVFTATWVLHSWQWFWVRGSVLLSWSDTLFWFTLAMLVAVNAVRETQRPSARRLGRTTAPTRELVATGFKAAGVFAVICVLWSLWISESVRDWLSLFRVLLDVRVADLRLVPLIAAGLAAYVLASVYYQRNEGRRFVYSRSAVECLVTGVVLIAIGWPPLYQRLTPMAATVLKDLKSTTLNDRDLARRQHDYYEQLKAVGWDNPELSRVYQERPEGAGRDKISRRTDLSRSTSGLPYLELLPGAQGWHRGIMVELNRWGMHDTDCALSPAPDRYRIALLGASQTFAIGVAPGADFESLVETRINQDARFGTYQGAELLNFAAEGYTALDVLAEIDQKVFSFRPDAVMYVVHPVDAHLAVQRLAKVLNARGDLTYPALHEFVAAAGAGPGAPEQTTTRLLSPQKDEILAWAYRAIAARCHERGCTPVMVYLPILTPHEYSLDAAAVMRLGREAGFEFFDLSDVYDGHTPEEMQLAEWDDHPNPEAHQRIAERLYRELRGREMLLAGTRQREDRAARERGTPETTDGVTASVARPEDRGPR